MPAGSRRSVAEFYLLCATVLWGATFAVVKAGLEDISPLLLVAVRFSIASILWMAVSPKSARVTDRRELLGSVRLGVFLFLGFATQTVGLRLTTAARSAFITGTLVIFTPLFQLLLERRALKSGNLVGIAVILAGLWLLTSPHAGGVNPGDLLTLLCAIFFGYYIVDLNRVAAPENLDRVIFYQMAVSALAGWITLPFLENASLHWTPAAYGAIGYTSVLATLLTTAVQTRFQRETSPTRAAVIFTLEPVWASIFSFFWLGEKLSPAGFWGASFIVLGVLLSELSDLLPGLLGRIFRSRPGNR